MADGGGALLASRLMVDVPSFTSSICSCLFGLIDSMPGNAAAIFLKRACRLRVARATFPGERHVRV